MCFESIHHCFRCAVAKSQVFNMFSITHTCLPRINWWRKPVIVKKRVDLRPHEQQTRANYKPFTSFFSREHAIASLQCSASQSDTSRKQKSEHHPPRHVIYNAQLPYIQVDRKQKEGDFLSRQGFEDQKQEVAMHYCQYLDPFGKTLTCSRVGSRSVRGYTLKTYTYGRETPRYITLMY